LSALAYLATGTAAGWLILFAIAWLRKPPSMIGADVEFLAFHHDGSGSEGCHPHTWTVTCWVRAWPWQDLRVLRSAMWAVVDALAHEVDGIREIAPASWTNEAVGNAFFALAGVRYVHVDRPGFHARLVR